MGQRRPQCQRPSDQENDIRDFALEPESLDRRRNTSYKFDLLNVFRRAAPLHAV